MVNRLQYHRERRKKLKDTFQIRFWARVDKRDTCWIWKASKNGRGYGIVVGYKRTRAAHRISYELSNGRIPNGKLILHNCDNPSCVNPGHLTIGTQSENIKAAYDRGRKRPLRGTESGKSKITMNIAKAIRLQYVRGKNTYKMLAKKYGISDSLVGDIILNKSWH